MVRERAVTAHLEIETYTWDVIPGPFRAGDVVDEIAREIAWTRAELEGKTALTALTAVAPAKWRTYLRLGRVSNLPTVWSNTLAGMVLAGAPLSPSLFAWLAVATSLQYVGGMFLNDAFDRAIDARERPERPIPAGIVTANEVFGSASACSGSAS